MANIKDLGFIKENKNSHDFDLNETITIEREGLSGEDGNYYYRHQRESRLYGVPEIRLLYTRFNSLKKPILPGRRGGICQ